MLCGKPLEYFSEDREAKCVYCGGLYRASELCKEGHYVCDGCHAEDALEVIENICLSSGESDVMKLLEQIRSHKAFAMHGPAHHAAGLRAGLECAVQVLVDWQGVARQVTVQESSGALVYDISARTVVSSLSFSKECYGKELVLYFRS